MQHFHSIIFQDTEATPKGHPLALESGSAPPLSTPLGASHIPPSKNPNFSWWPIRLHTTSLVFSLFFPLPFFYPPRCATPHRPPLCSSNTPGLAVPQGLCTGCSSLKKASSLRYTHQFSLVQSLSHVRLFATLWTAACQATLFITNSRSLLKRMSIESVTPSNHLILCCPLLLLPSIFPSIRVFSNKSVLYIKWPKYWSFSFSISPSNDYSGLISFRNGFLLISCLHPHPLDSSSLSPSHAPALTVSHSQRLL